MRESQTLCNSLSSSRVSSLEADIPIDSEVLNGPLDKPTKHVKYSNFS